MSNGQDRRTVLRAGAALGSLSMAGCLGLVDDDDGGNGTDGNSTDDGNGTDPDGSNGSDSDDPDWETIERWPQYQFDAQNTGYAHANVSPENLEQSWSVEIEEGPPTSPVVADDTAYFYNSDGVAYAIDEEGVQWETELGDTSGITPVLTDDRVVVATDSRIVGLNRSNGSEVWRYNPVESPRNLLLSDGVVYSPSTGNELAALDAKSGERNWNEEGGFFEHTAIHGDRLFVPWASGSAADSATGLAALNLEEGWSRTAIRLDTAPNTGLTIRGDTGFFGADDGVYAYDLAEESQLWHYPTDDPVEQELAATEDTVFVGVSGADFEGTLHAVSRSDRNTLWTAPFNNVYAPAVAGNAVFVPLDLYTVAAYDAQSGNGIWSLETTFSPQKPIYANGRIYVVTGEGSLYCFEEA